MRFEDCLLRNFEGMNLRISFLTERPQLDLQMTSGTSYKLKVIYVSLEKAYG